jgi:protein-disulfide isomerase
MTRILALVALAASCACSSVADTQDTASGVAAQVGDRVITLEEVEARWRMENPVQHAQAMQGVYDGRRAALDAMIAEILLAEAAEGSGLSPEAYAEAEIAKRASSPTDADVEGFYRANVGQMQGGTLEEMAPLITRFLEEQSRTAARDALIASLRRSGPDIQVSLETPRYPVDVDASDPSIGNASAPVTIVEFSDFECPFCRQASPTLKKLQEAYGDQVRIVWKDFPLTQIHPQAFKAAEAAHCAGDQGRFWEYHDRLFANQSALQPAALKGHASDMRMDTAQFNACLDESKYAERVRAGMEMGTRLGVDSTPTMYINGRAVAGAYPYETLAAIVDEELARAEE